MGAMVDKINAKAHTLEPLTVGDHVHVQNQYGNHPSRWDKTGVIVHVGEHDKYMVRVHGSRRVTARNRRFLRRFVPFGDKMAEPMPLKPMSVTEEHVDQCCPLSNLLPHCQIPHHLLLRHLNQLSLTHLNLVRCLLLIHSRMSLKKAKCRL